MVTTVDQEMARSGNISGRVETREQATRRLAEKARQAGVRLTRDRRDGRHYASSVSRPGTWHYVTGLSCDCQAFMAQGRCMHHSALLTALGWVGDEAPASDPPAVALAVPACEVCHGRGYRKMQTGGGLSDWETVPCACTRVAA